MSEVASPRGAYQSETGRTHRWSARCRDTPHRAKLVSQVLSYVVDRIVTGDTNCIVRDANGDTVGEWSLD